MKVLFIGSVLPEKYETKLKYISNAGNRFSLNLIRALEADGHDVSLLSYIGFPVEGEYLTDTIDGVCTNEEYILKSKVGMRRSLSAFKSEYRKQIKRGAVDCIVCYNCIYPWFGIEKLARKYGIKCVLMLADYSDVNSFQNIRGISKLKSKIMARLQLKHIRMYERVIGLSHNIENILRSKQEFIHIEGGIDIDKWSDVKTLESVCAESVDIAKQNGNIRLMYAGLLGEVPGVDLAVKSFMQVKNDCLELHISGMGPLSNWIEEQAKLDSRIHFHGRLNYDEYVNLLGQSHILLNPRNMNLPENQNNFPSKFLEYLATGRVIVSTKFAGWEKFRENAIFTETSVEDFTEAIEYACGQYNDMCHDIYDKNRKLAREFDWKKQVKKII